MAKRAQRWYVGYSDGQPYLWHDGLDGRRASLYTSRREAAKFYEDVREVRLTLVERPTRGRTPHE